MKDKILNFKETILTTRKKAFIALILFWAIVGITSGLIYDLEWFIQHVMMFNSQLSHDIKDGAAQLQGVHDVKHFYTLLGDSVTGAEGTPIREYYDTTIEDIMGKEAMIFSAGALIAALISGPLLTWGINKKKNYILFVVPVLVLFAIVIGIVAPMLTTTFLVAAIFTPIFGLGYSYRTALDPWGTTFAKKTNIRISFVRAFYEIGSGVAALVVTQIYFQYAYYNKEPGYGTSFAFYALAVFLIILAMFVILIMPNKQMFEETRREHETQATIDRHHMTFKDLIKSKQFIIGLVIFLLLIGTTQSFGSVWVNTVENVSTKQGDVDFGAVRHIGYMKVASIVPRFLIAVFILQMFKKVSLKTLLVITGAVAATTWALIGVFVYVVDVDMIVIDIIGGVAEATIASMAVLLGYEFVSRVTNVNNRNMAFVVFNTAAYGIGGIVFVQLNGFLSKTEIFGYEGLLVWFIMAVACGIALLLIVFAFKNPPKENIEETISNEQNEKLVQERAGE